MHSSVNTDRPFFMEVERLRLSSTVRSQITAAFANMSRLLDGKSALDPGDLAETEGMRRWFGRARPTTRDAEEFFGLIPGLTAEQASQLCLAHRQTYLRMWADLEG